MRAQVRLVRNGNSTQVTIPRPILMWIGWLPGEDIVITVLEDKSLLLERAIIKTASTAHQKPRMLVDPYEAKP